MPYFSLGVALLIGFFLLGRWFINASPVAVAKALRWVGILLLVGFGGFLAITGRIGWALLLIPVLLPWLMRLRQASRMAKNFSRMAGGGAGPGGGQSSEVHTRYLRMQLDHATGEMNGEVLEGPFTGRKLSDLAFQELLALYRECASVDEQSAQILSAFFERYHPGAWATEGEAGTRTGGDGGRGGAGAGMNREEAYDVLGLAPGATDDEIKAAHHRLMSKIHPDHGGSTYLATKINQAKDFLLGE